MVVDRGDVGVVESGEGAGLAPEAGNALGILRELRRQDFHRHVAAELRVARTVDLAHAALAELRKDFVMREGLADQVAGLRVGGRSAV